MNLNYTCYNLVMIRDLSLIPGVGPKNLKIFKGHGISNTYDLVTNLPKKYENFSLVDIENLKHLEEATIIGLISAPFYTVKKRVVLTTTTLLVQDKVVKLLIFGRDYISKEFSLNDKVIVKGKYNMFKNEINVTYISKKIDTPNIQPIYQIEHISDRTIQKMIEYVFSNNLVDVFETLPTKFIEHEKLMHRKTAILTMHFPKNETDLEIAQYRFKVEEAFFHLMKYHLSMPPKLKRTPLSYDVGWVKEQISLLPYQMTLEQQEAVNDCFRDFKSDYSMYRLIQGDVGTGKTFVTFIAALGAISAGYQVAFLAPTEILARQHFENFNKHFGHIPSALLTSSLKDKKETMNRLNSNDVSIVFGTHILSSESVIFDKLGLVVIDEQHKFGVETRENLIKKSVTGDTIYLSATPIPRSLSLTYFGSLEVSNIKQKPVNTTPIESYLLDDKDISKIIAALKVVGQNNEQSFIVVPAISEGNKSHSIHSVFSILEPHFNPDDFYVIHGQLKYEEIELIMDRFMQNPKGILLSTTIIEVGIDVKNASTIIIMGADNFGLSQLHQLRGRVGRGSIPGKCYFVSSKKDVERLNFLLETTDGFLLSQYDLKLRGPGVFSSIIQSGYTRFEYLDLNTDLKLLQGIVKDVKYYVEHIEKYPYLKKRIFKSNVI